VVVVEPRPDVEFSQKGTFPMTLESLMNMSGVEVRSHLARLNSASLQGLRDRILKKLRHDSIIDLEAKQICRQEATTFQAISRDNADRYRHKAISHVAGSMYSTAKIYDLAEAIKALKIWLEGRGPWWDETSNPARNVDTVSIG
jgi:hypothetical protein